MSNVDDLPDIITTSNPIWIRLEIIDSDGKTIPRVIQYNRITKEAKIHVGSVNGQQMFENKILTDSSIRFKN